MPCMDPGPSQEWLEEERQRNHGAVVGLCRACAELERIGALPSYLGAWYAAHKACDLQREIKDRVEAEMESAMRDARSRGFDMNFNHPARLKYEHEFNKLVELERIERREQRHLATLK